MMDGTSGFSKKRHEKNCFHIKKNYFEILSKCFLKLAKHRLK